MKKQINVILVEDNPAYRKGIACALNGCSDLELVSEFGIAEVALRSLQDPSARKTADVILLDLNLPGMSGLEAIPWFKKHLPHVHIIVLTQSDSKADILRAIQSGAAGYLLKSASIDEITQGIRTVMMGGASLDSGVARLIIQEMVKTPQQAKKNIDLNHREMQVLTLLSKGLSKKEIAKQIKISPYTVADYVKRIYSKLNVENGPAAIHEAHLRGLFPPEK